jgi:hypothetical protein
LKTPVPSSPVLGQPSSLAYSLLVVAMVSYVQRADQYTGDP